MPDTRLSGSWNAWHMAVRKLEFPAAMELKCLAPGFQGKKDVGSFKAYESEINGMGRLKPGGQKAEMPGTWLSGNWNSRRLWNWNAWHQASRE